MLFCPLLRRERPGVSLLPAPGRSRRGAKKAPQGPG
jgi:hypothetical protein